MTPALLSYHCQGISSHLGDVGQGYLFLDDAFCIFSFKLTHFAHFCHISSFDSIGAPGPTLTTKLSQGLTGFWRSIPK